jgi:nanoRNase/pAp phosphatase (c-di-AMP/oligoRNAs hydrolase)
VCHRNADADAYLSAYALARLLKRVSPRCMVDVVAPGGMTALTAKLAEKYPCRVREESEADYDLYVAVDVGDDELLESWRSKMEASGGVKVLVDHHPYRDRRMYQWTIVDEEATSAAEVVFGIYRDLRVKPDRRTAQALLEGIMFDSGHFALAGNKTIRLVVELIDSGADVEEARRTLRTEPDYGEVIAKLKGAQRLKIYRIGKWVVATTEIGSFQAHVARSLLSLGADVTIAGGESDGEVRVSMRASGRFHEGAKVELGKEVAEHVAVMLGGHGGGHSTAASFTCAGEAERAIMASVERLSQLLKEGVQEVG